MIAADEEVQQSMASQRPLSDAYRRGTPAAKRQKVCAPSECALLWHGRDSPVGVCDVGGVVLLNVRGWTMG